MMTTKGVDTTDHTLTGATLAASGYAFVCRYVQNFPTGTLDKELRAAELPEKKAAGVRIVSNWEWAAVPVNSRATGKDHATRCQTRLASLGAPDWAPVYYSIDTPAVAGSYNAYAQGWRDVYPADRLGVYGDGALFRQLKTDGYVTLAWQSMSRSFPGNHHPDGTWNHDGADIIQTINGTVAGHSVDFDSAVVDNYGGWLQGEDNPMARTLTTDDLDAIFNDPRFGDLTWRVYAMVNMLDTYNAGTMKGNPVAVTKAVKAIQPTAVPSQPVDLDALAAKVADLLAARLKD